MKHTKILSFLLLIALTTLFTSQKNRPVHIFMAGDSTMSNKAVYKTYTDKKTGEKIPEFAPERGWGMVLQQFFTDDIIVSNYASNGKSTRTFREAGLWKKIMTHVQKGDYVVVQFGHNDDISTKKAATTPDEFKANLKRYVDEVRAQGATPILCTPIVRRSFGEDGQLVNTHGDYPEYVKEVAKANKVILIDLHERTHDWITALGDHQSKPFFMHIQPDVNRLYPNGLTDNTHLVEAGAVQIAQFFTEGLEKEKIKALTKHLKSNESPYVSKVWVSDLGNGKYKNPVLYADYSDPDVCRVGDDYYMTASSFNCIPGLPILHSKDMVNWSIIGHAIQKLPPVEHFSKAQHGNGVWAPAIRYRNGEFYIYYGDPDFGIYMTKTKDPAGEWEPLTLVKEGKGLIDACPLWDNDGQAYLVHAYAGSRAGFKSVLAITKLTPDGKKAVGTSKIIYDGHDIDVTVEGPKFNKRNGYYYIFAPAGGVSTGWQLVLRSTNVYGPYERRVVMHQGNTPINGPHQGAWVDTPKGEDWFFHFQDTDAFGRVVHLQPMQWINDWPVIGEDKDGDGIGEPVLVYKKPNIGKTYPITTPIESDEFSSDQIGLQWQWHANPTDWWHYANKEKGTLSLYSVPIPEDYKSLWDVPNLLLQKLTATDLTATTKITFTPAANIKGERTGLVIMGRDYALLSLENTANGLVLSQNECMKADRGGVEKVNESVNLKENTLYLCINVKSDSNCTFSYSTDGKKFKTLGKTFKAREGQWIGAKVGLFCSRPVSNNDGGRVEIDWFRFDK